MRTPDLSFARIGPAVAALAALIASPVHAQTPPAPATPGQAAAGALYEFCLPLFGPGAVHADRISATAAMAGMSSAPRGAAPIGFDHAQAAYVAPSPAGSNIVVFWVSDPATCQIIVLGSSGADDLLSALTSMGWTPAQQNVQTGPDTVADVWTGQPRGFDQRLVLVANRPTGGGGRSGGVKLVMNLMRAD